MSIPTREVNHHSFISNVPVHIIEMVQRAETPNLNPTLAIHWNSSDSPVWGWSKNMYVFGILGYWGMKGLVITPEPWWQSWGGNIQSAYQAAFVLWSLNKGHSDITFSKCHGFPTHHSSGKSLAIFLPSQNRLPDWGCLPCSHIFLAEEAMGSALLESLRQDWNSHFHLFPEDIDSMMG